MTSEEPRKELTYDVALRRLRSLPLPPGKPKTPVGIIYLDDVKRHSKRIMKWDVDEFVASGNWGQMYPYVKQLRNHLGKMLLKPPFEDEVQPE